MASRMHSVHYRVLKIFPSAKHMGNSRLSSCLKSLGFFHPFQALPYLLIKRSFLFRGLPPPPIALDQILKTSHRILDLGKTSLWALSTLRQTNHYDLFLHLTQSLVFGQIGLLDLLPYGHAGPRHISTAHLNLGDARHGVALVDIFKIVAPLVNKV